MGIIKPGFAATSTSTCSCGLGMFAYVKRYVPEAIIVLQKATFSNRIRRYIRFPQFSFQSVPLVFCCISSLKSVLVFLVLFSLSFSHFQSVDSCSVPVQSVILFLQC